MSISNSRQRSRIMASLMLAFMAFTMICGFSKATTESFSPVAVAHASNVNNPANIFDITIGSDGKSVSVSGIDDEIDTNTVVDKGRQTATVITALLAIVMFVVMLWQISKLATSSGNDQTRRQAQHGILYSGIALALFGGSSIVIGFFWNFLTST